MAAKNGGSDGPVSKYETEEGLKEVAAFLRGRNGMPLRPAIEVDKRVEYFKGETRKEKRCSPNTVRWPNAPTYTAQTHGLGPRLTAVLFLSMPAKVERDCCVPSFMLRSGPKASCATMVTLVRFGTERMGHHVLLLYMPRPSYMAREHVYVDVR